MFKSLLPAGLHINVVLCMLFELDIHLSTVDPVGAVLSRVFVLIAVF